MSVSLALLCAAAAAAVAFATSALTFAAWPLRALLLRRLSAAAEARLLLAVAAAPLAAAAVALGVSFLPSFGWGADHCLAHDPHHPHLCVAHLPASPAPLIVLLGGALLLRVLAASVRAIAGAWTSRVTARKLMAAASGEGDALVLPGDAPEAFVLGIVRPRLYVSAGLLALSPELTSAVLAHERAHLRRRDPLRRCLAGLLLAFHLPGVASLLRRRLLLVEEMAADDGAAAEVGDRAGVASALVALARLRMKPAASGISFAGGNVGTRVRALLDPPGEEHASAHSIAVVATAASLAAVLLAGPLHHGIETLLGLLG